MRIPTQIPSSPPRIPRTLVSTNSTLKKTPCGGDVNLIELRGSHFTSFSIISFIPKVWKRQVGEEYVIQVIEQGRLTRVRLITCYFHSRNQAMESLDLSQQPPNVFFRDSELYSIDVKSKIELLLYALLKILGRAVVDEG